MALSLGNFVSSNVNILEAPVVFSIGRVALLTEETTAFGSNKFLNFTSAEDVAVTFGINSKTYKSIKAMYNQENGFNITQNYSFVAIPLDTINNFNTALLSAYEYIDFSIFTTTYDLTAEQIIEIQDNLPEKEFVFIYSISDSDDIETLGAILDESTINIDLTYNEFTGNDKLIFNSGFVSKLAGNDTYTIDNTTLHFKSIKDLSTDEGLQQIDHLACMNLGINTYGYYKGGFNNNICLASKYLTPNQKATIINIDKTLQNYLLNKMKSSTINKDDGDFVEIKNDMSDILKQFRNHKGIGLAGDNITADKITIGNSTDGIKALKEQGFYIYIPSARTITGTTLPITIYIVVGSIIHKIELNENIIKQ